jgi:hypothetical protein
MFYTDAHARVLEKLDRSFERRFDAEVDANCRETGIPKSAELKVNCAHASDRSKEGQTTRCRQPTLTRFNFISNTLASPTTSPLSIAFALRSGGRRTRRKLSGIAGGMTYPSVRRAII